MKSDLVNWQVMPWQWQRMPEYWEERIGMYLSAKAEVAPVIRRRHERAG